jgi:hypothetical protein
MLRGRIALSRPSADVAEKLTQEWQRLKTSFRSLL